MADTGSPRLLSVWSAAARYIENNLKSIRYNPSGGLSFPIGRSVNLLLLEADTYKSSYWIIPFVISKLGKWVILRSLISEYISRIRFITLCGNESVLLAGRYLRSIAHVLPYTTSVFSL